MRTTLFIATLIISTTLLVGCSLFVAEGQTPEKETPKEEKAVVEEEPVIPEASEDGSAEILLAKCLTEQGAKLYTASWCGHCKKQKAAFKGGVEYLDNTECADGDSWSKVCKDAGVQAVPTWIFKGGEILSGNRPLSELAEIAGCDYPASS